jgi:hypothetical protein
MKETKRPDQTTLPALNITPAPSVKDLQETDSPGVAPTVAPDSRKSQVKKPDQKKAAPARDGELEDPVDVRLTQRDWEQGFDAFSQNPARGGA